MHTSDKITSRVKQEVWKRKWSHGRLLRYAAPPLNNTQVPAQQCIPRCYSGRLSHKVHILDVHVLSAAGTKLRLCFELVIHWEFGQIKYKRYTDISRSELRTMLGCDQSASISIQTK